METSGSTANDPGSLPWAKAFSSKELWSLTLGPAKSKEIPTETKVATQRYASYEGLKSGSQARDFKPSKQCLRVQLSKLRYPPSSIECWWRETTEHLKAKKAHKQLAEKCMMPPPDLIGSLDARPFPLRNNLGGPEAQQPPHFDEHLLRPEQLRSLAWMLGQELPEAPPFGVEWRTYSNWQRKSDSQMTSRSADVWYQHASGQWEKKCTLPAGTSVTTRGPPFSTGNVITGYYSMQSITEPQNGAVEVKKLDTMQTVAQHELRVHGHYEVRGGILADRIGYGKTATTIGLIDSTLGKPLPEVPRVDRGRFKPVKATLILTPSNLLDQWIDEIGKFVHTDNVMRLVGGWGPKECPLKVFAMKSVTPLKGATVKEIAEADIVICSYRLLYSQVYQARRDVILGEKRTSLHNLAMATERAMQSKSSGSHGGEIMRLYQPKRQMPPGGGAPAPIECANIDDLMFPLLEQFYWRRVVFDEFHELESFQNAQQVSLQHMRAHYRWGLTGTPPVGSNAGVIFMSSLFRVDLPGCLAGPDISHWENDKLLTQMSLRFLDRYARQNAAELPEIPLEEEIVRVSHTTAERALYLGQAHDAPDLSSSGAFDTAERVQALQRLLKLCSHFQGGGGDSVGLRLALCACFGFKVGPRAG
jgi:SNF2 family DNA or RNA helicase